MELIYVLQRALQSFTKYISSSVRSSTTFTLSHILLDEEVIFNLIHDFDEESVSRYSST